MWEDSELKIKLYLYPTLAFALGTLGLLNSGWEYFGYAMFAIGFVISLNIIIVTVIRAGEKHIREDRYRIEEQAKLYKQITELDPEARYQLGLASAPKEVKVVVDKTKEVGNEFSQTWRKIPLASFKLKVVAQAALNGEGFTIRKWAGDGKLLSRDEWDATHKAFLDLGMLEPVGTDPREGYMWTSFGEDVLAQIVKDNL